MAISYNAPVYLLCENCKYGKNDTWSMSWRQWQMTIVKKCPNCNQIDYPDNQIEIEEHGKFKKSRLISVKGIEY